MRASSNFLDGFNTFPMKVSQEDDGTYTATVTLSKREIASANSPTREKAIRACRAAMDLQLMRTSRG